MQLESEFVNELYTALAKAQSEMCVVDQTSTNPFFKSKYAKLDQLVKISRPQLSKYGLSVLYKPLLLDDGTPALKTILAHSSGQWTAGIVKVEPLKKDHQAFGSALTYAQRQSYKCLTGVVCGEDDDGEAAMVSHRAEEEFISDSQLKLLTSELEKCPHNLPILLKDKNLKSLSELPKNEFWPTFNRVKEYNIKKT